ncbi:MAG: PQQ-dependent sugar dehydrogenase [Planctomycetes bacterium]|nr:PQQ-dependent sugar dehydrogenase [Planctomycetota bacterium]
MKWLVVSSSLTLRAAILSICISCSLTLQAADPFAALVRTTDPLTAAEEQKTFTLPPGFEIQLVASEPDIYKPLNMAFDARGRLWVTDTVEYPFPAPPGRKGRDTLKILEDTNGDGRADKITTFADGLNIAMGVLPYGDGAIVFSIPNIWYLRDTDGDGRADRREKLYGPFDTSRDAHGLNNSFRRGLDGWIYACHGFNNHSKVTGRDGNTVDMQSGNTYRFRPDGSRIEHFTHGQVNPFGMAADPLGNLFTADCHSKPIYQLLRGGFYPSFGKPHDGLGFVPPMMSHTHGSTAIAGITFYTGTNFPAEYRGNVFTGNVMTSRVNRNRLEYRGSTILAREQPDLVVSTDPWFRPVDIRTGPDGALYVADFYNRIIGHYEVPLKHPGRDRRRGRIWRIVYTGKTKSPMKDTTPAKMPADLTKASVAQLVTALSSENLTYRTLATHRLVDRGGDEVVAAVKKVFSDSDRPAARAHALWALHRLKALDDRQLAAAVADEDRLPRVHAMKLAAEMPQWHARHRQMALTSLQDKDAFVRRAAADALSRHPNFDNLRPLLDALKTTPKDDNHLSHTIRMALRQQLRVKGQLARLRAAKLSDAESHTIAEMAAALPTSGAGDYLVQHLRVRQEQSAALLRYLRHAARYASVESMPALSSMVQKRFAADLTFQLSLIDSLRAGLAERGKQPPAYLRSWAVTLATRLFDVKGATSLTWNNTPIEGKARRENPWVVQQRASADGNPASPFFCSLPRGEQLTGVWRSQRFAIPVKLSFYTAGHTGYPNRPIVKKNFIRLVDAKSGKIIKAAPPPRNDVAQRVQWDLSQQKGRLGYVEIVDGDDAAAYAWLAVGRFSYAPLNPSLVPRRLQSAAGLVEQMELAELKPQLTAWLTAGRTGAATRQAMARALAALESDGRIAALYVAAARRGHDEKGRLQLVAAAQSGDNDAIGKALAEAMKAAPRGAQQSLAEMLAASAKGGSALIALVEAGHASPRLLQRPTISQKLSALKITGAKRRIKRLTAGLPAVDATIARRIARQVAKYPQSGAVARQGLAVFEKHCAACHKVGDQGAMVGPQLDGIGNRGLPRLLEDILDPNRNVDVAFRTTTLALTNGKVISGLLRRAEGATLVLVDEKGKEFTVSASDVEQQKKSHLSLMPANFIETIAERDFHNLLAYLLSQRATSKK